MDHLNQSPLHLLHRVSQRASDRFAELVPVPDLTPRQFAVLAAVAHNEGLSQTALVAATGIDRSTLADIVRRMLRKGLLTRQRTKSDARAYAIQLTAEGRATLTRAMPAASSADNDVLAPLGLQDRQAFIGMLRKLALHGDDTNPSECNDNTRIGTNGKSAVA